MMNKKMFTWLSVFFCLLCSITAFAQEKIISGKVTDKNTQGELPSVTVSVKGTTKGTITDFEGNYKINVPDGGKTLVFTFVGYKTLEVEIGTQSTIDVALEEAATDIKEVVVVGYGTSIKQDLTGNIAKVQAKDIQNTPVPSFEQAVQGRAAGVYVSAESGKIGGGIRMRIRGASSISAGTEPLYVVDGVIITSESQSGTASRLNPLADLNTNDIASIDILKDAQATAIYGSRAANGVVIITTKKGHSGATKFNIGYQQGWSSPTRRRDFLNSKQYIELMLEAGRNGGVEEDAIYYLETFSAGKWSGANPTDLSKVADTKWEDYAYNKSAGISQFDFSAQGGNDKTTFFFSGQRSLQKGIIIGNDMERFSGRLNLEHKVNNKFTTGITTQLAHNVTNRLSDDNEFSSIMQIVALTPITPLKDEQGNYSDERNALANAPYYNPLINTLSNRFQSTSLRSISNAYASYEIIKGLVAKTEFAVDFMQFQEDRYWGKKSLEGRDNNGQGQLDFNNVVNYTTTTFLNYNKTFAEKHDLSVTVGQSFQKSTTDFNSITSQQFPSDAAPRISTAAVTTGVDGNKTQFAFLSYFGRLNYKFNNKYLFGLSARVDGSSRFGANKRYGFFPAVSAGWILSEESFLKENKVVSFLKLRASYGLLGNANIPNNAAFRLFGAGFISGTVGSTGYAGRPVLRPTQYGNPDLTWENMAQLDIGIDFGILKDRITGEIDYYQKNTTDMLLSKPLPSTSGYLNQFLNLGSMTNRGFEFVLNTANLVGDFKWNTSFNVAYNINEVTNLGGDSLIDNRGTRFLNVAKVGQPLGVFYGREFAGVDKETGDALYYTNDGTKSPTGGRATTNNPNAAKDAILGNSLPKFTGGFTNTFSYKGFDLSILFQFVQGNMVYNAAGGFMTASFDFVDNQTTDMLNRWQKPGDVTNVPQLRLYGGNGTAASNYYLSDASFVRLKNIQLGYNLPKSIVSKAKLNSARVYVVAQNLLTFTSYTGWDPEVSTDYLNSASGGAQTATNIFFGNDFYSAPQIRTFSVGVNLGF